MTVCLTTTYDSKLIGPTLTALDGHAEVRFGPAVGRVLDRQELIAALDGIEVVIAGDEVFDDAVFEALPQLQLVARDGMGYNAIDLDAATRHGVRVTNSPVMHVATATLAIGLIIALVRRITVADRRLRTGGWTDRAAYLTPGLDAMTLGIIGYGNIGRGVAARALPLGMQVLAFSRGLSDAEATASGVQRATVDQILAAADVVSIHVPLSDATRGLIGAEQIARMRPGSYLVNTSRGPVVDEAALIDALRSGHLAGAALDVFEQEPVAGDNPLLQMDNVVLTPHMGSDTTVAIVRAIEVCVANIRAHAAGEVPPNLLNPQVVAAG